MALDILRIIAVLAIMGVLLAIKFLFIAWVLGLGASVVSPILRSIFHAGASSAGRSFYHGMREEHHNPRHREKEVGGYRHYRR